MLKNIINIREDKKLCKLGGGSNNESISDRWGG
jgi:hypothetical protein